MNGGPSPWACGLLSGCRREERPAKSPARSCPRWADCSRDTHREVAQYLGACALAPHRVGDGPCDR